MTDDQIVGWLIMLAFLAIIAVLVAIPTMIAFKRHHPNRWLIMVVNIAFGGTGVGWLVCLIWALNAIHRPADPTLSTGGESGLNLFVNDPRELMIVRPHDQHVSSNLCESSSAAAIADLERANQLRSAGHLTDSEFQAIKAAVLHGLNRPSKRS